MKNFQSIATGNQTFSQNLEDINQLQNPTMYDMI